MTVNTTRDMAKEVVEWARLDPNIRVVILTSTRANPNAEVDELSDYDIELYVEDLEPFLEADWPGAFGEVLVREPYKPELSAVSISKRPDGSRQIEGNAGCMVIFKDAPRIDFCIELTSVIRAYVAKEGGYCEDMGFRVLLDKDGLAEPVIQPTYTQYNTTRPTQGDYEELVYHFWWDVTYVAKMLFRDELFFAKRILDFSLHHHYLKTAIAWYIGMNNNWSSNPGNMGRWFKKQLDPEIWSDIEATFAGADLEENWAAMFKTAEVFERLASEVGRVLGFAYPFQLGWDVTQYLTEIKALAHDR